MRNSFRLAIGLLASPFFLATSCVRPVYFSTEYALPSCPASLELPEHLSAPSQEPGLEILAVKAHPVCQGFRYYSLRTKETESLAYAGITRSGAQCKLQILARGLCGYRESVEDCRKKGIEAASARTTTLLRTALAQNLPALSSLPSSSPTKATQLEGDSALPANCH